MAVVALPRARSCAPSFSSSGTCAPMQFGRQSVHCTCAWQLTCKCTRVAMKSALASLLEHRPGAAPAPAQPARGVQQQLPPQRHRSLCGQGNVTCLLAGAGLLLQEGCCQGLAPNVLCVGCQLCIPGPHMLHLDWCREAGLKAGRDPDKSLSCHSCKDAHSDGSPRVAWPLPAGCADPTELGNARHLGRT